MKEIDLFLELVQVSIGRRAMLTRTPTPDEWQHLYALAEKQALLGVCFAGVKSLEKQEQRVPQTLYYQWLATVAMIQQRNEEVNGQCITLLKRLAKDGYRSCILKGQGVAQRYGSLALYRQSGDIDVWMAGTFEDAIKYAARVTNGELEVNEQHVHLQVFKDTEVELHFTPSMLMNRLKDRRLQRWFNEQRERQMNNFVAFGDDKISVPTDDFNLVYLLLHIYRHLFAEGIGLRQLMDYYFLLKTCGQVGPEVMVTIGRLGMGRFASAIMWVLGRVFGLEETRMICKPDERRGRFILNEIMASGNFGHGDNRFQLDGSGSHLKRYLQMCRQKLRFLSDYPSETCWIPVDILLRFFSLRKVRREARKIAKSTRR